MNEKRTIVVWGECAYGPYAYEDALATWRRAYELAKKERTVKPKMMHLEEGITE